MSDMSALVKVLRYLRDNSEPSSFNDIISAVQEGQAPVDGALNRLVGKGIVDSRDSRYPVKGMRQEANAAPDG